jgi:hypothetical protein
MLRSAAVSRIQQYLGFRSDKSAEIITALQDTQTEFEREAELPWFLRNDGANPTLTLTISTYGVNLPTGFLREIDEDNDGGVFYYNSTADDGEEWTQLEKMSEGAAREAYQDSTGAPEAYVLTETQLLVFPLADAAYILRFPYYKADTTLGTDVENDWLKYAHELMIGNAGLKIAAALRDKDAIQIFAEMERRGRDRLMKENVSRQEANKVRIMGGVN